MSETIEIVVPMAPDRALLPNVRRKGTGGSHWSVQSDATAELRTCARLAVHQSGIGTGGIRRFSGPVVITYEVVWPYARYKKALPIPDADAVPTSCKAIGDALVDMGVLGDDGEGYVAEIRARSRRGMVGEAGHVLVEIEEAS